MASTQRGWAKFMAAFDQRKRQARGSGKFSGDWMAGAPELGSPAWPAIIRSGPPRAVSVASGRPMMASFTGLSPVGSACPSSLADISGRRYMAGDGSVVPSGAGRRGAGSASSRVFNGVL
jgi:hypothetical protein